MGHSAGGQRSERVDAALCVPLPDHTIPPLSRRAFLKLTGVGGALSLLPPLIPRWASAELFADQLEYRNHKPSSMAYRRLGKTNMMVSTVALGGAGNYGTGAIADDDPAAYEAMMETLMAMGVNYFDTAQDSVVTGTGGYATEDNFAYLCDPSRREKVFISTKIEDIDNAHAKQCIEAALTEMNTDYIDIVYIHHGNGISGSNYSGALGCFDAIDEMIAQGKVRYKGMTSHVPAQLTGLLQNYSDRVDAVMGFRAAGSNWQWASGTVDQWNSVYSLAAQKNVGVVGMKIFMSAMESWETRESKLKGEAAGWARVKPYVDKGATIPQACVQWAVSNEDVKSVVLGMRTVAEAEEDAGSVEPDGGESGTLPSRTSTRGIAVRSVPNPFAESTTIRFHLEQPSPSIRAAIYAPSGVAVKNFDCRVDGRRCSLKWDGRNEAGQRLAPGRYVLAVSAGRKRITEPLVLLR